MHWWFIEKFHYTELSWDHYVKITRISFLHSASRLLTLYSVHRHLHNISEILQIKLFSKKPNTFFIHNPPFIGEDLRRTDAASSEYCVRRRRVIKFLIMALSSAQWMELRAGCREKLNLMILFFYFHQTNGRFLPWVASSGWLLRCGLALATHTRNENEWNTATEREWWWWWRSIFYFLAVGWYDAVCSSRQWTNPHSAISALSSSASPAPAYPSYGATHHTRAANNPSRSFTESPFENRYYPARTGDAFNQE